MHNITFVNVKINKIFVEFLIKYFRNITLNDANNIYCYNKQNVKCKNYNTASLCIPPVVHPPVLSGRGGSAQGRRVSRTGVFIQILLL